MYQTDFESNQTNFRSNQTKPNWTEPKWFDNGFKKYQTKVNGLGHDLGLKLLKPTHVQPYLFLSKIKSL